MTEHIIINTAWKAMQTNKSNANKQKMHTYLNLRFIDFFNFPASNAQTLGPALLCIHNFRSQFTTLKLVVA
jgi:hypothetical protein